MGYLNNTNTVDVDVESNIINDEFGLASAHFSFEGVIVGFCQRINKEEKNYQFSFIIYPEAIYEGKITRFDELLEFLKNRLYREYDSELDSEFSCFSIGKNLIDDECYNMVVGTVEIVGHDDIETLVLNNMFHDIINCVIKYNTLKSGEY